jgi:hypothetical protein
MLQLGGREIGHPEQLLRFGLGVEAPELVFLDTERKG